MCPVGGGWEPGTHAFSRHHRNPFPDKSKLRMYTIIDKQYMFIIWTHKNPNLPFLKSIPMIFFSFTVLTFSFFCSFYFKNLPTSFQGGIIESIQWNLSWFQTDLFPRLWHVPTHLYSEKYQSLTVCLRHNKIIIIIMHGLMKPFKASENVMRRE